MVASDSLLAIANLYQRRYGKPNIRSVENIPFDEQLAKDTADYFVKTPSDPSNPQVAKAYNQFKKEVKQQYNFLKEQGLQFIPTPDNPYGNNSANMARDIRENGRIEFYTGGAPPEGHPLAEVDPETGLTYNNEFRAVHDFFGHATHNNSFGPVGERRAFIAHSQMFSPEAIPALAFETHAQNSFVNYGPHLRDASGRIAKKGEPNYLELSKRPYAEQKANILPARLSAIERAMEASE